MNCAYREGLRGVETWPHICGFVQEEAWNDVFGWIWTICEEQAGALASPLAEQEKRWALSQKKIVALETADGVLTFIIPNGRRITSTARLLALDAGAAIVFDQAPAQQVFA